MTKIAGSGFESESGSISQRHGSVDPDPHQNSWIRNTATYLEYLQLDPLVSLWAGKARTDRLHHVVYQPPPRARHTA
jgi:hypothetical protein